MDKNNKKLKSRGQTLMEVVVALGVVLFVLISIIALVLVNIFGQKASENKTIASNLAREGIEIVRNLRDSAMLKKADLSTPSPPASSWHTGLDIHYGYLKFDTATYAWSIGQSDATWANCRLYQYHSGSPAYDIYMYDTSASSTYTPFERRLSIDTICVSATACSDGVDDALAADCVASPDIDADTKADIIGYRVKSQVRWLENNQTINIELVDYLYDWR